ncbi:SixA phosphatase family protein [Petrotoga sibirica]|uniref:Phosphohistidine phosphatase SixA n=1 Tax=Petrotoga sibirica TaxID=156202 RepID=A0A4R8EM01_9BACT|nr:histidine phosphatase family protein [Petrotoga sibirica]TDX13194.1 phosphohistidine phosphatase SixA [Petrotoga sibirica]
MKNLILVRHAKAEKRSAEIDDFERKLTKVGRNDSKEVAEYVAKLLNKVELMITSPALRAKETAEIFEKSFKSKPEILEEELLYEGEVEEIIEKISNITKGYNNVMIFGHNPTFDELAKKLTGDDLHLRKAGVICIVGESFDDILSGKGKLKWMVDPKSINS